jgi:hypothetical protein
MSAEGGLKDDSNYQGSTPFGTTNTDGSQGDKGEASSGSKEFLGAPAASSRFGDKTSNSFGARASNGNCSAQQMGSSGHD